MMLLLTKIAMILIDNENIHEGDEYNRQITGGPSEGFMKTREP